MVRYSNADNYSLFSTNSPTPLQYPAHQFLGLFNRISAAITPGIHPNSVRIKTINMEPHPLSITDKGGKIIARITLQMLINLYANNDIFNFTQDTAFTNLFLKYFTVVS